MTQWINLKLLMEYIGRRYRFTSKEYPIMAKLNSGQKKAFALNHSVLHMGKSLGKLATECERYDHGRKLNEESVKEATVKMFINSIKLAEEMGIDAKELGASVHVFMKSK